MAEAMTIMSCRLGKCWNPTDTQVARTWPCLAFKTSRPKGSIKMMEDHQSGMKPKRFFSSFLMPAWCDNLLFAAGTIPTAVLATKVSCCTRPFPKWTIRVLRMRPPSLHRSKGPWEVRSELGRCGLNPNQLVIGLLEIMKDIRNHILRHSEYVALLAFGHG